MLFRSVGSVVEGDATPFRRILSGLAVSFASSAFWLRVALDEVTGLGGILAS